jgi:hypothetical protein
MVLTGLHTHPSNASAFLIFFNFICSLKKQLIATLYPAWKSERSKRKDLKTGKTMVHSMRIFSRRWPTAGHDFQTAAGVAIKNRSKRPY